MPTYNSDCGCNSNGGSNCYEPNAARQQMLYPLLANDCTGQSGGGSNCEQLVLSAQTSSACVTIPAIGATFNVSIPCGVTAFRIGMWLTNPALGKYPIVGINAATNLLTLQNSCLDGETAITGNPSPGTQVCGPLSVWLTGSDPCLDAEAFCAGARECLQSISEDNPLCLPDIPVTTSAQCVYMLGLSAACDSGDCPQPDDPNCLTKLDAVRFCEDSIIFQDGLEEAEEDECVRPVVINEDGKMMQAPPGSGITKPTKVYLGQWQSGFTNGAGLVAALNFQVDLSNFEVPECAVGCWIRAVYNYDFDTGSGDGPYFTTFLRATGQPSQNIAYAINNINAVAGSSLQDRPSSDALGAISVVFGTNKVIFHELQDQGTQGGGNYVSVRLWLDSIIL